MLARHHDRPTECILEIRYKPNPKILDYRGTWAEKIATLMELPKWRITENRVDVHDEDNTTRAFVSFRNAGLVVQDSPTRNYFPDKAIKLLRFLLKQDAFGKTIVVPRLGVRYRSATPFAGPFSELLHLYTNRYLSLTPEAQQIFEAKIIDSGGGINFTTQYGKLNTTSGPMLNDQLQQFFRSSLDLPDVALYLDLDYHKEPESEMAIDEISNLVKRFAESVWDIEEKLNMLILA